MISMKRCSTSCFTRKIKIKTKTEHYFACTGMTTVRKTKKHWQEWGSAEPLFTTGKEYMTRPLWKRNLQFLKGL